MQRSVFAEIFGYLVCLLCIAIFFMSVAGIVNSVFRAVNPEAGPHLAIRTMMYPPGDFRLESGDVFYRSAGTRGGQDFGPVTIRDRAPFPPKGLTLPKVDDSAMRNEEIENSRFDSERRFVLSIVMLVLAYAIFRRTFAWLNPAPSSS